MPAYEGGAARTGAGVRKPPMEETAGGVARWRVRRCGDLAAVSNAVTPLTGFMTVDALAVNGANTSAPFDTNASLPATASAGTKAPVKT
jgi:hypothetical protein